MKPITLQDIAAARDADELYQLEMREAGRRARLEAQQTAGKRSLKKRMGRPVGGTSKRYEYQRAWYLRKKLAKMDTDKKPVDISDHPAK
jgi:hypothetical protein